MSLTGDAHDTAKPITLGPREQNSADTRYICIHGHFYQPPRENPSLEAVQIQDSAYPYHDWNERITAECYGPNGASRILDGEGRILKIANNYARMSYNFGPTLLAWLEKKTPEAYHSVLAADRESRETFSGHGSALAQAYNHVILPLANERDVLTQVAWGIGDFEHRFGRFPEGMWLPETAVNLETLDALADKGIRFTILAQHQALRVRKVGSRSWQDVAGGRIDPTMAYRLALPSGRMIDVFFYDGPISRGVAFEGLLDKGENLAGRLIEAFSGGRSWPQLVHIATDGETYGHHHRNGDMALAYALHYIESNGLARLTNYGEYLEKHPPTHEVEILENTSWSCAHGIERWRSDCGCNSGGHGQWNQSWRAPLRAALDWLRDALAPHYEKGGSRLFVDPWMARNEYISVILDRSPENVERFLADHATHELEEADKIAALKLLEMQRHAMLMYTSCGWFFDELSGIETVQVLQYAGRAVQLAQEIFGVSLEPRFLGLLERARSNLPEHGDGRRIYEKLVKPGLADLLQVGAHYAVSSLFENYGEHTRLYCYTADREAYTLQSTGKIRLALGRARISSGITREVQRVDFGVLHLGDHNLTGGVREPGGEEGHEAFTREIREAFSRADLAELIRAVDKNFGSRSYSLRALFLDEQRKILDTILESTVADTEAIYRQIYERHASTMRFLAELRSPMPKGWQAAAELAINANLRRACQADDLDLDSIASLLDEATSWGTPVDGAGLGYALRQNLERTIEQLRASPRDLACLQKLERIVQAVHSLPFQVNLWKLQNIYYGMLQSVDASLRGRTEQANKIDPAWFSQFIALGDSLGIRVAEVAEMHESKMRVAANVAELIAGIAERQHTPRVAYRLQFNPRFTFRDAQELIPYLYDLGISDCYASPLLRPRSNSSHGYDICDHSRLNPAFGSAEDFDAFATHLREREMGLIFDIVPNHMGINDACNVWWMDVLENGPGSVYASYFDIDWQPVKPELQNKVLLPILEDQYGKVLEDGKFRLAYEEGAFFIFYHDIKLPVAPRTYIDILKHQLGTLIQALGDDDEHVRELKSILTALSYLPLRTEKDPEKIAERHREKEVIKGRIAALFRASAYVRAAVDSAVQAFNGSPGDPRSFDILDKLLDEQAYRPAFWRVAAEEINYRRFFDVNELAAIHVEMPEVFAATHQLSLRLLAEGKATGLRIDHPDGLWNPRSYFRLLQESHVLTSIQAGPGLEYSPSELKEAVSTWFQDQVDRSESSAVHWPLYVVAEKILSGSERIPESWPVDGTTGYDFLNAVNGLFVDSRNHKLFDSIYSRFVGGETSYANLTNSTKKMIMLVSLASEINALGHQLERIAEKNRLYRDFTLNSLIFAIREVIAALPVYRTYVTGPDSVGRQDQSNVEAAVAEAKRRNPRTAEAIFDFVRDSLLLRNLQDFPREDRQALINLIMKFQQVTGPVMAKGVEDTAFYIYNRLVSLNEVGGHPERFGISVATFHKQNIERRRRWPRSLIATSTHDTKRSEDVRARINVLSEIPGEWKVALLRWSELNGPKKTVVDGEAAPDRNDEYLLYQTLLGTWPEEPVSLAEFATYRERIGAYMRKATKEAKVHTSWVNPNEQYDAAVQTFVQRLLVDAKDDPFIDDLRTLQRRVAYFGRFNALSQTLLKLTSPGVPDIYQGTELWDYSLVDPDNRRGVDYRRRSSLLADLKERQGRGGLVQLAGELLDTIHDGRIKLYLIYRTLTYRRVHDQVFATGSYLPLEARGEKRLHVCSFLRANGAATALVVAPRLMAGLTEGLEQPPLGRQVWQDTRLVLPRSEIGQRYRNLFTQEDLLVDEVGGTPILPLSSVCAHFPLALLVRA